MDLAKGLQYCWDWAEYWEEFWIFEETCCLSNFNERPSANADTKNSHKKIENGINSRKESFLEVKIQTGIFQGDTIWM